MKGLKKKGGGRNRNMDVWSTREKEKEKAAQESKKQSDGLSSSGCLPTPSEKKEPLWLHTRGEEHPGTAALETRGQRLFTGMVEKATIELYTSYKFKDLLKGGLLCYHYAHS